MLSFLHFSLFFALLAPLVSAQDGFSIPLTRRAVFKNEHGVANGFALRRQIIRAERKLKRGVWMYHEHTGKIHNLAHGFGFHKNNKEDKRATASVLLRDHDQQLWEGNIAVGTPPKTFTVDFDTGSSDMFIPSTLCNSTCSGHLHYNPKNSSTSKKVNKPDMHIRYKDGSEVSAAIYSDTVSFASLKANNQSFGAATKYSSGFSSRAFPADGLLGMGYPSMSLSGSTPFFNTLINQKTVTASQFAFKLTDGDSSLFLGGVDKSKFKGSITYENVVQKAFWQIQLDHVGTDKKPKTIGAASAVVDTGTTLILAGASYVKQIYATIPGSKPAPSFGQGFYTVPCNAIPTLSFTFSGRAFKVKPSTFNLGLLKAGSKDCVGGLAAVSALPSAFVIGDVFLQNVYSVFDFGKNRVGFADLA